MSDSPHTTDAVASGLALIDRALAAGDSAPSLETLARHTGLSAAQMRRAFVTRVGLTPKAYADAARARLLRESLASGTSVADALFESGFSSTSRVYERHGDLLGMTPAAYRRGAPGETIRYGLADSSLGRLIVGLTDSGVCFIAFGDTDEQLIANLSHRFSRAAITPAAGDDSALLSAVVALIDDPTRTTELPLDIRGTAFQQRVWRALTRIAPGETVTYGELARRIGQPSAVRAVAQACGSNPVAVVVPCHRVIGADGTLTGYRWGVERKQALLEREQR